MRVVVWIPDGDAGWTLPPAVATDHGWLGGGRQTMHELAVAIACSGRSVEIRGEVDVDALHELSGAAGAGPELPSRPRALTDSDTVFVYEGIEDPLIHARLALSPARVVLMVLAPPGLVGWPFAASWSKPDPLTVALDSVARPEHFRAAAELGFELWTNSAGLQLAAEGAGVACRMIGRGLPAGFPDPPSAKDIDVLVLGNNRWTPLARLVAEKLEAVGVRPVLAPAGANRDLLELMGRARTLVHPMRVEGASRIACEARAMGAVPVVLGTNPYGAGLDEAAGAVPVESVAEMAGAVTGLLADPDRLERLAAAGMETARRDVAWQPYVERVDAALAAGGEDPGRGARAGLGGALQRAEHAQEGSPASLEEALAATRAELARHQRWLKATNASLSWRLTVPLRWAKRRLGGARER